MVGNRRVGGHEGLGLHIAVQGQLDGGGGAQGDGRLGGLGHGQAQSLAALVRPGGDEGQTPGHAGIRGKGGGGMANGVAGGHQPAQLFLGDVVDAPGEGGTALPAPVFVVKGHMADHIGRRVGQHPGHFVIQIGREHDILGRFIPNVRLALGDPVAGGGAVDVFRGRRHPRHPEHQLPMKGKGVAELRLALVQPEDDVPQGLVVPVQAHHRVPDGGEGHGGHPA